MLFTAPLILSLLGYVAAQATSNGTATQQSLEIESAEFEQSLIVPDLLPQFDPQGLLSVTFNGQAIATGQSLEQSAVGTAPTLAVSPGSDATELGGTNVYTVMMIDADVPGTNGAQIPTTRHWLVNGASLSASGDEMTVGFDSATTITDYAGPGPAEGSGPHRYVVLVYLQPSAFTAPANLSQAGTPLSTMFLQQYVQESGLGDLVAANYFQVEVGQATVSFAATTPVNTATFTQASSTPAASGSSVTGSVSMSMSQSGSASPISSGAAASSSGAALTGRAMGWDVTIGAVGVVGAVFGAGLGF